MTGGTANINSLSGSNFFVTTLNCGTGTITSLSGSNIAYSNISGSGILFTSMTGGTANINSLSGSNAFITNMFISSITGTNGTGTSAFITSISGANAFITNFTGGTATLGSLSVNTGTIGSLSVGTTKIQGQLQLYPVISNSEINILFSTLNISGSSGSLSYIGNGVGGAGTGNFGINVNGLALKVDSSNQIVTIGSLSGTNAKIASMSVGNFTGSSVSALNTLICGIGNSFDSISTINGYCTQTGPGNLIRLIRTNVGKIDINYSTGALSGISKHVDFVDTDNGSAIPLSLAMDGSKRAIFGGNITMINGRLDITTGSSTGNIGIGTSTLTNTSGINNTAVGYQALASATTGYNNTCVGFSAGNTNIASTYNNTCIGAFANMSSDSWTNSTALGYGAIVSGSNTIQLGNTSTTLINTSATINCGGAINPLYVNTSGIVAGGILNATNNYQKPSNGQGAYIGWNRSAAGAETNFVNNTPFGSGGTGGGGWEFVTRTLTDEVYGVKATIDGSTGKISTNGLIYGGMLTAGNNYQTPSGVGTYIGWNKSQASYESNFVNNTPAGSNGNGAGGWEFGIRTPDGVYGVKATIDGGTGKLSIPSILLGSSPTALTYYEEYTFSSTFTVNGSTSGATTIKVNRVGSIVTLTCYNPLNNANGTNVSQNFISTSAIPAQFRPSVAVITTIAGINNGANNITFATIQTNGLINLLAFSPLATWNGVCWWNPWSISYNL